jgi:hypothetical protein
MSSPRKTSFWILAVLFSLIFLASVFFLAAKLTAVEAPWTLPVYIVVFLLFVLLYFTPAYLWLSRQTAWARFGVTLILLAPTLLLSIWLGLAEHDPIGPLVWFAPFLGIAVGMNLRVALGRVR